MLLSWRFHAAANRMPPASETTIARGGRALYGVPLGILMLEARFPRIPGDMGNATTWPFPVLYHVVRGASPEKVVLHAARGLLPDFIAGAKELVRLGAEAITTNCGFLSLYQKELAAAAGVPVATSSLMQVPWVQATLPPGRRVGVVTISAATLSPDTSQPRACRSTRRSREPRTGASSSACSSRRRRTTWTSRLPSATSWTRARRSWHGIPTSAPSSSSAPTCRPTPLRCRPRQPLPVYDIYSMISWFHAGLRPRVFDGHG